MKTAIEFIVSLLSATALLPYVILAAILSCVFAYADYTIQVLTGNEPEWLLTDMISPVEFCWTWKGTVRKVRVGI